MSADPTAVRQVLLETFGITEFRGGQEAVIQALFDGHSALAVFPTGAGKSLCYQLPAMLFDGVTLVISPLIALMKDQVEKLRSLGIGAARIDSTLAVGLPAWMRAIACVLACWLREARIT